MVAPCETERMDGAATDLLLRVYRTLLDEPPISLRTGVVASSREGDVQVVDVSADVKDRSWQIRQGERVIGSSSNPNSALIPLQVALLMPVALPIWGRRRDAFSVAAVLPGENDEEVRVIAQHRSDPDLFAAVTLNLRGHIARAFTSPYEVVRLRETSVVL